MAHDSPTLLRVSEAEDSCLAAVYLDFQPAQIFPKLIAIKPRERGPRRTCAGGSRVKEDSFAARANWLAISLRERATDIRHVCPRHSEAFCPVLPVPAAVMRKQGDALCGSIVEQIARPNLRSFFLHLLPPSRYRTLNLVAIILLPRTSWEIERRP